VLSGLGANSPRVTSAVRPSRKRLNNVNVCHCSAGLGYVPDVPRLGGYRVRLHHFPFRKTLKRILR